MATRTLAGDDNPDWWWAIRVYQHAGCGGEIDFHDPGSEPRASPRLALCSQCGAQWSRRRTAATAEGGNQWKEEVMNLAVTRPNGVTPWREWTPPEDELLIAMWPKHTAAEIAAHLDPDKASIQGRWNRLKKDMPERRYAVVEERSDRATEEETGAVVAAIIQAVSNDAPARPPRRREWTADEDAELLRLKPSHTYAEIAAILGRTISSVQCRFDNLRQEHPGRPAARVDIPADPNAPDPEIMALATVYAALSGLAWAAQERVLGYVRDRLELGGEG